MGDKVESILNDNDVTNKTQHQKSPHDKWKESVKLRKCKDFSNMSYWQTISTCNQL